jgi:2-C-methyl-D-erythritol 2,4-cyclodiphosphate synthase
MDLPFRIGQGWDTHRIEPNRRLVLGGITIPCEFGLAGHSDADVLLHAITDAVLGALALGDIGMHFPDTAAEWKGAESMQFLLHAQQLACAAGYEIANIDSTIILERPKLKDFRSRISERIAGALRIPLQSVSVKFKTAEGVGSVGEGKSCEAHVAVLLVRNNQ